MAESKTVFVVDDDRDFRDSMRWLLESAGYRVQVYAGGEEFLEQYAGECGCLLLDVRMIGMSGLVLQQELNSRGFRLPVIVITGHGDIAMAVQAMKNQALDFIEKPFDDEALLALVDTALAQARQRFSEQLRQREIKAGWDSLSKREREVADCVIKGLANREIAGQLGISIKTVEIHRSRAMAKMRAKNTADLVSLINGLD
jgi:two-component system, LuxR family, response regulator FixJ